MIRRKLKALASRAGDRIARDPRVTGAAHWVLGSSNRVADIYELPEPVPVEEPEPPPAPEEPPRTCYLFEDDCPEGARLLTRADLILMALLEQRMGVPRARIIEAFGLQQADAAILYVRTSATLETVLDVYLQAYPIMTGDPVEAVKSMLLLDSLLEVTARLVPEESNVPVPHMLDALFAIHDAQPLATEREAGSSRLAEAKQAYRWMNNQPLGDLQDALQAAQAVMWGKAR